MGAADSFVSRLRHDRRFIAALSGSRNEEERKAVRDAVEGLVRGFAGVLGPLIDRARSEPAFAQQLGRSFVDGQVVVTGAGPETSGSFG